MMMRHMLSLDIYVIRKHGHKHDLGHTYESIAEMMLLGKIRQTLYNGTLTGVQCSRVGRFVPYLLDGRVSPLLWWRSRCLAWFVLGL
jgi:hypothetical protein